MSRPWNDQGSFTINFRSTRPIGRVAFHDRVGSGGVVFVGGKSDPIEGLLVRSSQVTVAIHEGEPVRMDWRPSDSDLLHSKEITRGDAHVGDGRVPFWVQSHGSTSFLAIAIDKAFVDESGKEFGQARDFELRAALASGPGRQPDWTACRGRNCADADIEAAVHGRPSLELGRISSPAIRRRPKATDEL